VFDLNLYILTKSELDFAESYESLKKIRFGTRGFIANAAVGEFAFPALLRKELSKGRLATTKGRWFLNVFSSRSVNYRNAILAWSEDVFFSTKKRAG
jgi:hypothetical protein